jgi:predicted DNA-binding protein
MYSPRIKENLIRKLHRLKESRRPRKPLTFYVNEAIELYLKEQDKRSEK